MSINHDSSNMLAANLHFIEVGIGGLDVRLQQLSSHRVTKLTPEELAGLALNAIFIQQEDKMFDYFITCRIELESTLLLVLVTASLN